MKIVSNVHPKKEVDLRQFLEQKDLLKEEDIILNFLLTRDNC